MFLPLYSPSLSLSLFLSLSLSLYLSWFLVLAQTLIQTESYILKSVWQGFEYDADSILSRFVEKNKNGTLSTTQKIHLIFLEIWGVWTTVSLLLVNDQHWPSVEFLYKVQINYCSNKSVWKLFVFDKTVCQKISLEKQIYKICKHESFLHLGIE